MEIERFCVPDLIGWRRRDGEEIGTPWKEDWSKKEVLVLVLGLEEREEVRVVAIVAIEENLGVF